MTALTTREALIALTTQTMVTGYVTLLPQQDAIRRNLEAGMSAGEAVVAVLGDEPSQFLDIRRDLTEGFIDVATLADDETLMQAAAVKVYGNLMTDTARRAGAALLGPAVRALAAALAERAR